MLKSFRLCSTIITVLCSPIVLIHRTSSETLADNGRNLNIIEVLNTSESLWMYWETSKNGYTEILKDFTIEETMTCIRNDMTSITTDQYDFTQTSLLNGEIKGDSAVPVTEIDDYTGIFIKDTDPPKSMIVYDSDAYPLMPVKRMTLQYTDEESFSCSVFFIFSVNNVINEDMGTCEMYIRDSDVKKGPSSSCETFFKERCNSTKIYQPYSESCKTKGSEVSDDGNNSVTEFQ